jgi:hypothetical protein
MLLKCFRFLTGIDGGEELILADLTVIETNAVAVESRRGKGLNEEGGHATRGRSLERSQDSEHSMSSKHAKWKGRRGFRKLLLLSYKDDICRFKSELIVRCRCQQSSPTLCTRSLRLIKVLQLSREFLLRNTFSSCLESFTRRKNPWLLLIVHKKSSN